MDLSDVRLSDLVVKTDLERFATKEDLLRFATKEDLASLENRMNGKFSQVVEELDTMSGRMDGLEGTLGEIKEMVVEIRNSLNGKSPTP